MSVNWWIDIENASGTVQGGGPLQPTRWRSTRRLNKAGTFEFEIPATDTRAANLLQQKYIARCYAVIGGATVEVGAGIIEEITLRLDNNVPVREVRGPDLLSELRRVLVDKRTGLGLTTYFNLPTFVNDDEVPYKVIHNYANAKLASSWAIADEDGSTIGSGATVTGSNVYARFRDETALQSLVEVARVTGEHFRLGTGRVVEWIGPVADFDSSGVRAIYDADGVSIANYSYAAQIANINRIEDSQGIVNRVIVYGSGEGDNRLTLRAADEFPDGTAVTISPQSQSIGGRTYFLATSSTSSAVDSTFNCYEDNTSTTAYGVHEASLQFNNIAPVSNTDTDVTNAANQLLRAAHEYLLRNAEPTESYELRLVGCNSVLEPGQTIDVLAQRFVDGDQPIDIDDTLNILDATIELDATGLRTSDLVVSTGERQPMTDTDIIVSQATQSYIAKAHPQIGPNVDTLTYKEDFDDTESATLNFWLGAEIAQVQQILLRFRVDPLRSTVKSVGGSASVDVTSTGHDHDITVSAGSAGAGTTVEIINVGGTYSFIANTGSTRQVATQLNGTGVFGTVDLSSAITTTYGIFEDSGGSVITNPVTQATFFINGNTINTSDISSTGVSGWYEIDLTDLVNTGYDLIDGDTLRPVAESNSIVVTADTNYRGRITAQLQIRASIQSVAYTT